MSKDQTSSAKVFIVGAGISGLIAAQMLESYGYAPVIFEKSDRVGGRVKTDIVEGHQLDRGFQVLLESYPLAQKYLNYDELNLQAFLPGAVIFNETHTTKIGDPTRAPGLFLPTLFSSAGGLRDKRKIWKLNKALRKKTLESIFQEEEQTTYDYLKSLAFSDKIIASFFRPFFSGIFLEPDLQTSSRMFEYVYKMFGTGMAVIPAGGMEAIPKQLVSSLKNTTIEFNEPITQVENGTITLENGEKRDADFTIVATDPSTMVKQISSTQKWKSCDNLYFTTPSKVIEGPIIGLNAKEKGLVNNIFYNTSLDLDHKGQDELLSVTVVQGHGLGVDQLIDAVEQELILDFGIHSTTFLHHYEIPRALPDLNDLKYEVQPGETLLSEKIALAGDHLLNGSLNAAMSSGESAAMAAASTLENH